MKLLLIKDDRDSSAWLGERLGKCGFVPDYAQSAEEAIRHRQTENVRAILVDPGAERHAADAVSPLRRAGIDQPVMVLSAREDWRETVAAFDAGADDYLVKPVRSDVIAARLRAIIRRTAGNATDKIVAGNLRLDLRVRCAWRDGKCLDLTRNEFRLLRLFLLDPSRVMTQEQIHRQLCPDAIDFNPNAIEVQIARLRRKVGKDRIVTIRGMGYRFVVGEPCEVLDDEPCRAGCAAPV